MNDITLSETELRALTGGYKRPCDQLPELHRLGFYRARVSRITGRVVLERAHYDAISGGQQQAPKVRQPQLRAVT